jgi:glycosyltransferase involved in cell wall biosynthesis
VLNPKKRILILCDWFLPGFLAGGPIQSIAALTHHLKEEFDFKIITSDTDFKATEPYQEIQPDTWTSFAGRSVYYISRPDLNAGTIAKLINDTPHDVLYLNSMFSKYFAVIPLQLKRKGLIKSPLVLAPRGMLSEGAFKTKTLKKQLFLIYGKATGLFKGLQWQSTSPQETKEIRQKIGAQAKIREASNLPNLPLHTSTIEKLPGEIKLCYVARICETKNLLFAIDVLCSGVKGKVAFDIYGPVEDQGYWNQCLELSKKLPVNITMNYKGALSPQDVSLALSGHHALFLPTHNENFGHAMVEALQCSRPIIISDQTPWRQLEQHGAGFDISLQDKQQFAKAINVLIEENNEAYQERCRQSLSYIRDKLSIAAVRAAYLKLFS